MNFQRVIVASYHFVIRITNTIITFTKDIINKCIMRINFIRYLYILQYVQINTCNTLRVCRSDFSFNYFTDHILSIPIITTFFVDRRQT